MHRSARERRLQKLARLKHHRFAVVAHMDDRAGHDVAEQLGCLVGAKASTAAGPETYFVESSENTVTGVGRLGAASAEARPDIAPVMARVEALVGSAHDDHVDLACASRKRASPGEASEPHGSDVLPTWKSSARGYEHEVDRATYAPALDQHRLGAPWIESLVATIILK